MDLLSSLKKGIVALSIPLVSSCSLQFSAVDPAYDPMYAHLAPPHTVVSSDSTAPQISQDSTMLEKRVSSNEYYNPSWNKNTKKDFMIKNYFIQPSFFLNDIDGDGIKNYFDPWPYDFGPVIDMNNNGFIDEFDFQINDFNKNYLFSTRYFNYPYRQAIFQNNYYTYFKHYEQKKHVNTKRKSTSINHGAIKYVVKKSTKRIQRRYDNKTDGIYYTKPRVNKQYIKTNPRVKRFSRKISPERTNYKINHNNLNRNKQKNYSPRKTNFQKPTIKFKVRSSKRTR